LAKTARRTTTLGTVPTLPAKCNVVPRDRTLTVGPEGRHFELQVSYPSGPNGCVYITVPDKPWVTTFPRLSEFDLVVQPNPRRTARTATVVVQGNMNRKKHRVTIKQAGR
jgi:hypothetical protein